MKKVILLTFIILLSKTTQAAWVNLNTGINDNLTGVVFWGNKGLVSGHRGIYYTSNGGVGAGSWTRFNISTNQSDSLLYNRTKFLHSYSAPTSSYGLNKSVACGIDTVNNKSVIMLIDLTSYSYSIIFVGSNNSGGFNKITYNQQDNNYYVVGDNGKLVKFDYNGNSFVQITTPFSNNFNAISFNTNDFCIGTNGNIINGTKNGASYTFTNTLSPANNYKDVLCMGLNYSFSVGNSYFKWVFSSFTQMPNYDFGNLNAASLLYYGNSHFVGTDHGIFKSSNTYNFLEWQPSSLNYKINSIWNAGTPSTTLYACGANGVVLNTTDNGGATKPLAKLNVAGACVGSVATINGITGTSNICKWYVDGVLYLSSCVTSFQSSFAVGQHTVQLNVTNSFGLQDTATQIFNVVNLPSINKQVSVIKSVLCQKEPLIISIAASEPNVYYTLAMYGNSNLYGNSGVGNNSIITFTSDSLVQGGNYYLKATSTLAQCSKDFTDTIKVLVEKTHANFHTATLNVPFSESVINYQNCIDAQNYLWTFNGGGPNISSSSVPNPTVSYSNVSPTSIKLICWSNNGCYDSLQKFGPNIFISPATQDSCWTMVNNAPDPIWQGHFDYDIAQLSPSKTGFLASGSYFKASFASRYGDSLRLSSYGGAYIGKYDFNGVLKWMNYTKQTDYNSYPGWSTRDVISSVKEDLAGNIYICGRASSYFYDNKGDSAMLQDHSTFFSSTYFIAKLDSSGKFLWRLTGYGLCPKKLITDNSNNIIVSSLLEHSSIQMELNGLASYTITNMSLNNTSLMKLSPFGNILWETKLNISATNFSGITGIGVDKNNNLLVTGVYEYNTGALYSPSSSSLTLLGPNFSTQGGKFFLLKYDTLGNVLWKVRALTEGTINGLSAVSASMGLDNEGNIYLTGTNENGVLANEKFVVYNADGSSDSTHEGQYFVLKINKNGFLKWINSTQNISSWEGLVIDVKGNEISTIGMSSYYLNYQPTAIFTSQNGINTTLTMGTDDYFIAIYDTLGNLNKIVTNGANSYNPPLIDRYAIYMHRDQQGAYYVGECMRFFIGASNYTTFNTTIASTNGWDGAITKFSSLNCGLVTYPNTVTGLSDKHLQSSILVYPNPSKNLVFINDSNPNLLVKLLSITGQDVPVRYINGTISIENLSSGMYFLLIYKDNKLYHQEKIIKE